MSIREHIQKEHEMIRYNWKTRMYDYYRTFFNGRPPMLICSFYTESDAMAYIMVQNVRC
jgi:hypothetical protein